jgi:glycosyltransferase involved in cell wall biosynthesis
MEYAIRFHQGPKKPLEMKVLMVISQFHPIIGGAEKQAKLLAQTLAKKGIDVSVITGWWRFGTFHKETIDGIKIIRNYSCWGMFGIKGLRPLGVLAYSVSLGIYLLIHRNEYDIIHVHQVLYPAFVSTFIGKGLLKKPILAKMGCSGLTSDIKNLKRFPLGNLQLKYLIKKMDCLVTVNREGIEEFHAHGYDLSRIQHIPNGVSYSLSGKTEYNRVFFIITAVRLDRQKGIDILLKAWAKVVAHENNLKLLIIGKGPHESAFKELSRSLEISDSVKFIGEVTKIEDYLEKSDIFILASRAEGMSNALLEAMSHGAPCIATNISGNSELMGESPGLKIPLGEFRVAKNGLLVNPEDSEALTKAILYLIRNRSERETLGKKAREAVRQSFSIDLIADQYIGLYRQLLGETA